MPRILRTNSQHPDFIKLVARLDAYLSVVDGDQHDFYDQYNGIESLNHVVIAYEHGKALGCGAFKPYNNSAAEIKRMFVLPEARGKGIASEVLKELEQWAAEEHFTSCILETGKRQTEAIQLYQKNGYAVIPNYGPYVGVENSYCFEKMI